MGYRSEVCGVLTVDDRNDTEKFKEMIGMIKLVGKELLDDSTPNEYGWENGCFVFRWSDVTWYDGYPAVEAWDRIFDLPNQIEGISGIFVRIGEEDQDIEFETRGENPDYDSVYVVREIDFPSGVLGKQDITLLGEQS